MLSVFAMLFQKNTRDATSPKHLKNINCVVQQSKTNESAALTEIEAQS